MLTENERLLLVHKKEEIGETTEQILELLNRSPEKQVEIDIKLNKVLELLSTIASFSEANKDINKFTKLAFFITGYGKLHSNPLGYKMLRVHIEAFCASANSVTFKFTKKGIALNIPEIDINLLKYN